jgi:hypothetical protein
VNIEFPQNIETDLVKGLLLFMGKNTDVSKDTFITLTGLCYAAILDKGDEYKERTAQSLDDAVWLLKESKPDQKEIYDKIYKMLDRFFIDEGLKKDEDFKTEKRKLEINYELARHKYLEFKKQENEKSVREFNNLLAKREAAIEKK